MADYYRVWCNTDNQFEYVWSASEPTVCPISGGHSIDTAKIAILDAPTLSYPPMYVYGCRVAWVSATSVKVGTSGENSILADSTDSTDILFAGELTANITLSGAGGLDTGSEAADTWYAIYVIADSTKVVSPNAILSTNAATPTLPVGYDVYRRVGWVRNDGSSNFMNFVQYGRGRDRTYRYYDTSGADLQVLSGGNATTFTSVDCSTLVPSTSRIARVVIGFNNNNVAGHDLGIRTPGETVSRATCHVNIQPGVGVTVDNHEWATLYLDATQNFEYAVTNAADSAQIAISEFMDEL